MSMQAFPLLPPPATLTAALAEAARDQPDAPFILHGESATGYGELESASRRAAAGLLACGIGPGDRIGLMSLNRIEWLVLFFACTRIGATVIAMSPRYREGELGHILRDSEVKAVATLGEHEGFDFPALFERLAAAHPGLQQLILLPGAPREQPTGRLRVTQYAALLDSAHDAGPVEQAEKALTGEQAAMVIYTSGTTGRPKGARLTHRSMLASAWAQAAHMRLGPQDLLTLANPLSHVGGITCGILSLMAGRGRVDLLPEFKAAHMLERIQLHRPTILCGVPTMMTLILMKAQEQAVDFSSIRLVYVGGSSVDPVLLQQLHQHMPQATLMNLYGLSETSGAIVLTPWDASGEDLMHTIGQPIGGAGLRVLALQDDAEVPAGEVGELCFQGCGVVPGYIGAARDNAALLPGGWLRTGDLGQVDGRGLITLKGRAKDMYIQGGFNVYPAEVESHMARHAGVLMVAGIGAPDPVLGEIGHFFVVRKPGATVTEAELRAWCAQGLADYKVPRHIEFRDALPLTPAGKIHKAALRGEAGGGQ